MSSDREDLSWPKSRGEWVPSDPVIESITIISNHGELVINRDGYVVSPGRIESDILARILRFNVDEFVQFYGELEDEIDIIEIGYWEFDWSYIPPVDSSRYYRYYCKGMEGIPKPTSSFHKERREGR